jgi:hypothetical protein
MPNIRRLVLRHTAGPYAGLRQIIGLTDKAPGELPDILPGPGEVGVLWPDNRPARALRLLSTDRYVLYQEQVPAA